MIAPIKKRLAQAFPIYELKITLCGSNPAIWRRVQVPGGIKLNRLHDVLQVVMGWTDSHLHQFRVGSVIYCLPSDDDFYPGGEQRDERRFRLADIAQREKTALIYEYDFGDGWEHEVVVEKVLAADSEKKCAVCLDGKNARPPEDCGGIFGYYDLLKAINNPKRATRLCSFELADAALAHSENHFHPAPPCLRIRRRNKTRVCFPLNPGTRRPRTCLRTI